jgi:hypothetical protein
MNFIPARVENGSGALRLNLPNGIVLPVPEDRTRATAAVGQGGAVRHPPEHLTEPKNLDRQNIALFELTPEVIEPMGMETLVHLWIQGAEVCSRIDPTTPGRARPPDAGRGRPQPHAPDRPGRRAGPVGTPSAGAAAGPCCAQRQPTRTHMAPAPVLVAAPRLEAIVAAIFEAAGCDGAEASRISRHLLGANLAGHDSHGVARVPRYVEWLEQGHVLKGQTADVVTDGGAFALLDGKFGFGQTVAPQAVALGIERATQHGIAVVGLRNAGHIGRVGEYAEDAIREA